MPVSKNDIVTTIRESQREIEKVASSLADSAWSQGVYEQGWNAKQLFCHLAENSGVAGFLIGIASAPAGAGGGVDVDVWNAQRVSALEGKSVLELLSHLRTSCERDIAAVQSAPAALLSSQIRAPWGAQGPLGRVIVQSIREHGGTHLADLRAAVA
ncbi:MAG: maleylpyruvate isomerase N-terminal domain-containing protein [Dehalococcoidia bacterium]|nr:maleylpyruvate isomerase N-terminal domain-containing protein [Dehalococcoidia bacterium]